MANKLSIPQHYQRILSLWPVDVLRPNVSFHKTMRKRLAARYPDAGKSPSSSPSTAENITPSSTSRPSPQSSPPPSAPTGKMMPSATPSPSSLSPSSASTTSPSPSTSTLPPEIQNINALYSLLENRYQKQYPLKKSTLHPASNPNYYDDLLREFKEVQQRGVLERWWARWKPAFRWK